MKKSEAKIRIKKLREEINYHRYLYHVLDRQEISDAALDSLKKELFDLEQQFPDLITPSSPTQRVGGEPLKEFKKVIHEIPMLSFNDAFSKKDIRDWIERMQRYLKWEAEFDFYCEPKIDGLAVSLVYENGIFIEGSTRGNGKIGEDVTQNLKTIQSIPLKIEKITSAAYQKEYGVKDERERRAVEHVNKILKNFNINKSKIEVRGEVYMELSDFDKLNKERKKKELPAYANPRNVAAGSIRQLDPQVTAKRNLKCFVYDIIDDLGQETHEQEHIILKRLGYRTNPYTTYVKNIDGIFTYHKKQMHMREKLPFEIDGIAVIVNDNKLFDELGVVGKAPRGSIAYKFPGREATTIVRDIKVQVGRMGTLTPVAILKPVSVGGVTVTHATLHNEDEIKRLGLKIGDTVIIQRAGDVIPDVIRVLPNLRTGKEKKFEMPKKCPVCGSKVIRPEGEANHFCTNPNCYARFRRGINHFISKGGFDIDGLGPKIIEQLIEDDLIQDAADIFTLEEGDLIPLERFAEKSANNLVKSIDASREIELSRFIYALGIKHVGEETAYDLANYFGSLKELKKASKERLEAVPDIGEVVAESIYNYFRDKKNKALVDKLIGAGIKIKEPKKIEKVLDHKTFVLTGSLSEFSRDEAKEKIRELGGEVSSSVSKKTDYVVAGAKPGSKYDVAKKFGVKIINEKEFLKMLK